MSEPLTPPDCDLRGMPFMPLDVVRLADSDLFALSTGDEFKAAVALWCKSWLQVPAASLPDDDRILAHLSGAGTRWARVKAMALRGWVKATDGRLYHPVVAEKAREAWRHRQMQRARANKRWGNAGEQTVGNATEDPPQSRGYAAASPAAMQGRGTVKGEGESRDTSLRSVSPAREARHEIVDRDFEDFWSAYPRKVGKEAARKAWKTARKRAPVEQIAAGLNAAKWPSDRQFIPHPATWLNQGRWQDEPADSAPEPAGKLDWLRDLMTEERMQ